MRKGTYILELIFLLIVPAVLVGCAFWDKEQTALLTIFTAVLSLALFFLRLERMVLRPREIMPIVILSAIAAAGRILFAPFPNFKPVSAIVIISGACYGRQSGFLTGALSALASNCFFGQGPWTPWQMYAWGLIGYLAGLLQEKRWLEKLPVVCVYGFLSGLLYGLILDSWYVIGFVTELSQTAVLAAYSAGLPFSLSHSIATVIFLIVTWHPWRRKIFRVQAKYGL